MQQATLSDEDKTILKKYGEQFKTWLDSESGKKELQDHRNHGNYLKTKLSSENLSKITKLDFVEIYKNLWVSNFWENKDWNINQIIDKNGLDNLKSQLYQLLYGTESFEKRYESFREKIKGFGISAISEVLNMIYPEKNCLWNNKTKLVLDYLNLRQNLPERLFKYNILTGKEYSQGIDYLKTVKDELYSFGVKDFVDLDLFFWFLYNYTIPKDVKKDSKLIFDEEEQDELQNKKEETIDLEKLVLQYDKNKELFGKRKITEKEAMELRSQLVFDTFWDKSIPTSDEIQEIKKNNNKSSKPSLKVIKNPEKAIRTAINLVQSAENEVLLLFSSANGFYRRMVLGDGFLTLQRLQDITKGNIKLRILTPFDKKIVDAVNRLTAKGIHIKYLPEALYLTVTFLIVDRKFSITAELVNDYTESPAESLGLSTFSNSKSTVLYYISMFENLWKQSDLYEKAENLYEQLINTNETQIQFIKETAHEIRNPITSILGLAEVMHSNKNLDVGHIDDLVKIIIKNAKKIIFLTDNILDAARIESQLLTLNIEEFDLVELVKDLLKDLKNEIYNKKISLILKCKEDSILLVADKLRLNQVFLNIINNAINIVQEGEIIVSLERQDNNNTVLVRIIDKGPGIPSNIKDKLFTKFVTGSKSGTGLGLYICKNIIEKHGGKIWANNNVDNDGRETKGSTFTFSLPIKNT